MSRHLWTVARSLFQRSSKKSSRPPNTRTQLSVTVLEARDVPAAVNIFTGAGQNDLWSNAANWSLNRAPIATDAVQLPANPHMGSTMDGSYTVHSLTVPDAAGQRHTLQGNLAVTTALTWSGQTLEDGNLILETGSSSEWTAGMRVGTAPSSSSLIVNVGAQLEIGGNSVAGNGLNSAYLENFGQVIFRYAEEGAMQFSFVMNDSSEFYNMNGGIVDVHVQVDSRLLLGDSNTSRFTNLGAMSVDGGLLGFQAYFDGRGTIDICCAGQLSVGNGGSLSATVNIGDPFSILWLEADNADSSVTLDHAQIVGLGRTRMVTNGTGAIFVHQYALLGETRLEGVLDGLGQATVDVAAGAEFMTPNGFSNDVIRNGLTLYIRSGSYISLQSNDFAIESGAKLVIDGRLTWLFGTMHAHSEGTAIDNNGIFDVKGNFSLIRTGTGQVGFECSGRLLKTLGDVAANFSDVYIWGTGTVEVDSGSIISWAETFGVGVTRLSD